NKIKLFRTTFATNAAVIKQMLKESQIAAKKYEEPKDKIVTIEQAIEAATKLEHEIQSAVDTLGKTIDSAVDIINIKTNKNETDLTQEERDNIITENNILSEARKVIGSAKNEQIDANKELTDFREALNEINDTLEGKKSDLLHFMKLEMGKAKHTYNRIRRSSINKNNEQLEKVYSVIFNIYNNALKVKDTDSLTQLSTKEDAIKKRVSLLKEAADAIEEGETYTLPTEDDQTLPSDIKPMPAQVYKDLLLMQMQYEVVRAAFSLSNIKDIRGDTGEHYIAQRAIYKKMTKDLEITENSQYDNSVTPDNFEEIYSNNFVNPADKIDHIAYSEEEVIQNFSQEKIQKILSTRLNAEQQKAEVAVIACEGHLNRLLALYDSNIDNLKVAKFEEDKNKVWQLMLATKNNKNEIDDIISNQKFNSNDSKYARSFIDAAVNAANDSREYAHQAKKIVDNIVQQHNILIQPVSLEKATSEIENNKPNELPEKAQVLSSDVKPAPAQVHKNLLLTLMGHELERMLFSLNRIKSIRGETDKLYKNQHAVYEKILKIFDQAQKEQYDDKITPKDLEESYINNFVNNANNTNSFAYSNETKIIQNSQKLVSKMKSTLSTSVKKIKNLFNDDTKSKKKLDPKKIENILQARRLIEEQKKAEIAVIASKGHFARVLALQEPNLGSEEAIQFNIYKNNIQEKMLVAQNNKNEIDKIVKSQKSASIDIESVKIITTKAVVAADSARWSANQAEKIVDSTIQHAMNV
ncbi:MAG: hypothetical protein ACK4PR_10365, partial [Gammaproteobacteria bacterium]